MEITIIFQIAAVGIVLAALNMVLQNSDKKELAMLTSLAGLVVVLFWVLQYVSQLFDKVQVMFRL